MNAATFYDHFKSEFLPATGSRLHLRQLAGKSLKWRTTIADGSLLFAFATNFKTAGLMPDLPGEFRLTITWSRGRGPAKRDDYVSLFQYTSDSEAHECASLERTAVEKFLRQPGKESLRRNFVCMTDPEWIPRPNIQGFHSYFDDADARAWGRWYGSILPIWTERFTAAPESNEDWAWRVLWPHLERKGKGHAS